MHICSHAVAVLGLGRVGHGLLTRSTGIPTENCGLPWGSNIFPIFFWPTAGLRPSKNPAPPLFTCCCLKYNAIFKIVAAGCREIPNPNIPNLGQFCCRLLTFYELSNEDIICIQTLCEQEFWGGTRATSYRGKNWDDTLQKSVNSWPVVSTLKPRQQHRQCTQHEYLGRNCVCSITNEL